MNHGRTDHQITGSSPRRNRGRTRDGNRKGDGWIHQARESELANAIVAFVGDVEIPAVSPDRSWRIELRFRAKAILCAWERVACQYRHFAGRERQALDLIAVQKKQTG